MSVITELRQAVEKLQTLRAEVLERAAKDLKQVLQDFIVENPSIELIKWNQYIPYFNDGDACEFQLGEIYFIPKIKIGDDEFDVEDENSLYENQVSFGEYDKEAADKARAKQGVDSKTVENCKELNSLLNDMEDSLRELFGEHSTVSVTAEGVEVDEYEHD